MIEEGLPNKIELKVEVVEEAEQCLAGVTIVQRKDTMHLSAHIPQGKGEVSILFMAVVVEMHSMPHKMRGRFNPPIGADEGRRVNVISVDGSKSDVDVMENKRTRQERGKETEEEGELRKKKGKTKVDDKPGSSKPRRK